MRQTVRQKKLNQILIVDSDELSLALIRASLETVNYRTHAALNSDQALAVAARESLDLVICDCDMRASTGVDVQTLVHGVPENSDVPFLFTSCRQKPDVISRRHKDRNVFFVRKPFEHEAFLELVAFAMWAPGRIQTHIEKIHEQQGIKRPHSAPETKPVLPAVTMPAFGYVVPSNYA